MLFRAKNGKEILFRKMDEDDTNDLILYYGKLSKKSRSQFEPHSFDHQTVRKIHENNNLYFAYVGVEIETERIVSYAICKRGILDYERPRLESYGIELDNVKNLTFAPSVSDLWHSMGLGTGLFNYILSDIHYTDYEKIFLWGGVQAVNQKAIAYYKKLGFKVLGEFEHNGKNFDMSYEINRRTIPQYQWLLNNQP